MKLFKVTLLLMLVVSLVPTLIVGWASVSRTRELLIRDAQELTQERAKQLRLKTEAVLAEPTRAALGLARVPGLLELPIPEQQAHLSAVLGQSREIGVLTLYDGAKRRLPGRQAIALSDVPPSELAVHEATARALLDSALVGLVYSEVYRSPARRAPLLTAAFPLGEPAVGYVTAEISLAGLDRVLESERLGSTGLAYVVDGKGRLVAGPGLGAAAATDVSRRPAVAHALSSAHQAVGAETVHVGNFGEGAERVVGAHSVLPNTGWHVISEQRVDVAYAQVATLRQQILLAVAVAAGAALVLAALFSRRLTQPLRGFRQLALQIAKGEYGGQVQLKAKNELGELAQTINYMSAQIEAYAHETKRLYDSLESGYLETIVALANSIDSKDSYTRGHSQRVGDTAVEIGRELGLNERELKLLHYGGILHDIGKIGIIDSILCKQTRLTEDEMQAMREHPAIGDTIIQPVSFLATVRSAVRNHHERWDGQGYPDGLKGDAIPLIARIVNCADTYDACTSTRPYQKALSVERALEIMEGLRGTQLDPKVLDALRRVVEKKGHQLAPPSKGAVKLAS